MKHVRRMLVVVFASLALGACATVGEDYVTPPQPQAGPAEAWSSQEEWDGRLDGAISDADLDPKVLARWWTVLDDATLTSLIERASSANLDLRTATARLRQARAQRKIAGAAAGPTAGTSGAATRQETDAGTTDLFSVGVDASWELDLFGGKRRGIEAAEADLQAAEEARRDVLVSVLAEVALNYIDLRTFQRRKGLAEQNLKAQIEYRDIVLLQEQAGAANQLDVDRATSNVETTRSQIPSFDQQIRQIQNRLAVLVGQNPGTLDNELADENPLPVPSVRVAVGVPADVLRRRPDVRQAERQLAAETARVGVAIAELYPKFTLEGSIGLEALSLSNLFEAASRVFRIGSRVQYNLFDGGRARQQIEVQNAVQEEALVAYERAILTALEDVENAITAFTKEQLRHVSLQAASESATNAAKLAEARFEAGDTDFLSVLDAQRTRPGAQDELAQSEGQITTALVRLYKALGGGWNPEEAREEDEPGAGT